MDESWHLEVSFCQIQEKSIGMNQERYIYIRTRFNKMEIKKKHTHKEEIVHVIKKKLDSTTLHSTLRVGLSSVDWEK